MVLGSLVAKLLELQAQQAPMAKEFQFMLLDAKFLLFRLCLKTILTMNHDLEKSSNLVNFTAYSYMWRILENFPILLTWIPRVDFHNHIRVVCDYAANQ